MRLLKLNGSIAAWLLLATWLAAAEPIVSVGKPSLRDIAYSPDGQYLATLAGGYLELLDAATHASRARVDGRNASGLLYSPDGGLLALLGASGGIELLDTGDLSTAVALPGPSRRRRAAFSPDGSLLAAAKGDTVSLWDTRTWTIVGELTGDDGPRLIDEMNHDGQIVNRNRSQNVTCIAFHPNGRTVAVGSIRTTVALWDVETTTIVSRLQVSPFAYARSLLFSDDGRFLLGATSGAGIALWETGSPEPRFIQRPGTDGREAASLGFSPDGRRSLVGDAQSRLRIVDPDSMDERLVLAPDFGPDPPPVQTSLNRLAVLTRSPDGTRLAGVIGRASIVVWDAESYAVRARVYGYKQTYPNALYLPKIHRVVTGVYSTTLNVWDARTGALVGAVQFGAHIDDLAAHPDGTRIAVDAHDYTYLLNVESMKKLYRWQVGGFSTALAFSPSGAR